ncbi:MAG TPA: hypothetical protein PLS90_07725 [Candidatus Sumerlaeota bacterium]|nr:hypothetical protein [Candidatus Sumerlaeota bacterium]
MRNVWRSNEAGSLRLRLRSGGLARRTERAGQSLEEREPEELSVPVDNRPSRELVLALLQAEAAQRIN